jgi:ABC-2 type transport system ATP-binding protein
MIVNNLSKNIQRDNRINRYFRNKKKGESFGLVGNNGAGKTTFQPFIDLIQPSTGYIINNNIQVDTSENWKPLLPLY